MLLDCEGLLVFEFLPPKSTFSSNKYCETFEKFYKAHKLKKPCCWIVKACWSVNFSHQKQQSAATNTVKLSKNYTKPIN
jgi:hypothetical protein